MKKILIIGAALMLSTSAYAELPNHTCSYAGVEDVARWDGTSSIEARALTEAEVAKVADAIDDEYSCNEGVDLLSVERQGGGAVLNAVCHADSMGSLAVKIELTCKEYYLN